MNKLVSKNPVQRFKEGKKIEKFQNPFKPLYVRDSEGVIYEPDKSSGKYYKQGDFAGYFGDGFDFSQIKGGQYMSTGVELPTKFKFEGRTYERRNNDYWDLTDGTVRPKKVDASKFNWGWNSKVGKYYLHPTKSKQQVNKLPVQPTQELAAKAASGVGREAPSSITNNNINYGLIGGVQKGWKGTKGVISDENSLAMLKEMGYEGGAKGAQEFINQNLAKYGLGNSSVADDDRWGDQSRKGLKMAYDVWKTRQAAELFAKPESNPNYSIDDIKQAVTQYTPTIDEQALVTVGNNPNLEFTPTKFNFNKAQTRDWLRQNNIGAYSITGGQRRAVKNILGGNGTDKDRYLVGLNENLFNLLKSKGYLKKGGVLSSRNPVIRFKMRGGSLSYFQKGGTVTSLKTVQKFKKPSGPIEPNTRYKIQAFGDEKREQALKEFSDRGIQFVRETTQPMQQHTAKASKRNKNITALQLHLWNAGAFNGVVDKRTGKQVTFERAVDGYTGGMTSQAWKNYQKMQGSTKFSTPVKESKSVTKSKSFVNLYPEMNVEIGYGDSNLGNGYSQTQPNYLTQIAPEDREKFADYLYKKGSGLYFNNASDVGTALAKNYFGINSTIKPGTGTQLQAVALHLMDKDNISQSGDTIRHYLGYRPGTNQYKWSQLTKKDKVHNGNDIISRAATEPGQHILGRFGMIETPDKYMLDPNEVYNFNESGTEYSKSLIDQNKASLYDYLRYYAGNAGANLDIPVKMEIPKQKILDLYRDFKRAETRKK